MSKHNTHRRGRRHLFKPVVSVIALVAMLLSGSVAASAAPPYGTSGTVTDIKFVTNPIQDGQIAELSAKWSFPDNPTGKTGFTIALPPELAGQGDTFNIKAQDTGVTMATCVATPTELQCDMDASYVSANPVGLKGNVNFWVSVTDNVTTEQEKTYVVGDVSVTTTVTPRPKCTENCELDFQYSKVGQYQTADHSITWYANIKAPAGGMAGDEEIVVRDTVSENQTILAARTGLQYTKTTAVHPSTGLEQPTNWTWVTEDARTISSDGTTISFTAEQGYYYRAVYRTTADDFGAAGTYTNGVEFTVNGVKDGEANGKARYAGGGGTGIGTDVGVITITKALDGTATGLPVDQIFTGTFSVATPAGDTLTGTWSTKAGETWRSQEFPRDSTVTLTEDKPSEPANVTWTSDFTVNDFTLPGGKVTPVTVTNTADVKLASFNVAKTLSGNAAGLVPDNATFDIDYSYPAGIGFEAGSGTLSVSSDGVPVSSPNLPVGAEVTLSEQAPGVVDGAAWGAAKFSPEHFVLEDAQTVAVVVDNPINEVLSGFSVRKAVTGNGAGLVAEDATFDIDYTWAASGGRSGDGTVQVDASGTPMFVDRIPVGAVVTLAERAPAAIEGVTWLDPVFSENGFTIADAAVVEVEVENPTLLRTGTFSVSKSVTGTAGALALVPDDLEYTIEYSYPAGTGFEADSGVLTVLADGPSVSSPELPYGARVTITEQAPAVIDGIKWDPAVISPAQLTIGEGTDVAVTVENPVLETLGGFALEKSLSGAAAGLVPDGTVFSVAYAWTAPDGATGAGTVDVVAGGDAQQVAGIPGGSVVTLTEQDPGALEGVQWLDPVFSENGFTIIPGTVVSIDLDNPTALRQGAFSVTKRIEGSGAALVAPETAFTIDYSYPAGEGFEAGSGSLKVAADGTVVVSDPLPYGAVVSLSEATPTDVKNGKWTGASFDTDTVSIGDGTVVSVVLTNTIDDVTPPAPEVEKPGLSATGAEAGGVLAGVALLLLGAGAMLMTRRRKARTTL